MADQKPYDIRCRSCGKRPVTHRNVFRYMAGAGWVGYGRGYRRYYLCPECEKRGDAMTGIKHHCTVCNRPTPEQPSWAHVQSWMWRNGWKGENRRYVCKECQERRNT